MMSINNYVLDVATINSRDRQLRQFNYSLDDFGGTGGIEKNNYYLCGVFNQTNTINILATFQSIPLGQPSGPILVLYENISPEQVQYSAAITTVVIRRFAGTWNS